jgi:hypothetical protein
VFSTIYGVKKLIYFLDIKIEEEEEKEENIQSLNIDEKEEELDTVMFKILNFLIFLLRFVFVLL